MTTITIKQALDLEKTTFESVSEALTLLASLDTKYNESDFEDTIVTPELVNQAKAARQLLKEDPAVFIKSSS